jgi:hypothetical protein
MPRTSPVHGRFHGIVIRPQIISGLPNSGATWDNVVAAADHDITEPAMASDQDADGDVYALAKALCYMREPSNPAFADYIDEIHAAITWGITQVGGVYNWLQPGDAENDGDLARARNITGWVLAANIFGLRKVDRALHDAFTAFLLGPCDTTIIKSRTLTNTHEKRPNNFGTHAGAARLAIAAYTRNDDLWWRCIQVYKGWLGDRTAYDGFNYGDLMWQADHNDPVGINPPGSLKFIDGANRNIDGVIPEEMRRAESLEWPPPRINYCYDALQGALLQAIIIQHASRYGQMGSPLDPFGWSNKALLRAYLWLNDPDRGNFIINKDDYAPVPGWNTGPEPDDYWQIPAVKRAYGGDADALPTIDLGAEDPHHFHGKSFGFTHWFVNDLTWLAP